MKLVGQSAAMRDVRRLIEIAAPAKTTVLVLGETGTGKELVARSVHAQSARKGELVSVNCSAIPTDLLESELFGYEKGAFTGAEKTRHGRFEMASGGTLFLTKLAICRCLCKQNYCAPLKQSIFSVLVAAKIFPIDLRLVCATHQNIEADIEAGKFRADLFYRINVFPIKLPTLAERAVDIPQIINALCSVIKAQGDVADMPQFDETAMQEFTRYPWPGNVRELRNVIERACLLFPDKTIDAKKVREHLLRLRAPEISEEQDALWAATADLDPPDDMAETNADMPLPHPSHYRDWFAYFDAIDVRRHLQEVEIVLIEAALEKSNGMISHAADALKLRRTTLIEKMKKFMIEKPIN